MKKPDFKEILVNAQKNHLSEHLSDDEIYRNILTYSADALDGILGLGFDFAAMQDVLAFYLLNSKECESIKREKADRVSHFVEAVQTISRCEIQFGVLCKAFYDMTNERKTV